MEIIWYGLSCFRLRGKEATVLTDPCPPSSGYNPGKPTADIVTISHPHENHSYRKGVAGSPRFIDSPGEYEIEGVFISGTSTYHDSKRGSDRGNNIAFVFEQENLSVCHLGDLGHTPTSAQVEEMAGVDVLMVPVGGHSTIDATAAAEVVALLEPKLVIPMHYKTPGSTLELEPLDRFLKEVGVSSYEAQPKLSITASSLPHEMQVVVLDCKQ